MQNNCPVCSGKSVSSLFTVKDHFFSGEEFEILGCKDCSLSYTLNAPDETEIAKYYKSDEYISHSDTKKGITNRLYHIARSWMLGKKSRIVEKMVVRKKGSLLDIGCGTGYFASHMVKKGWTCCGIETDKDARKYAEDVKGLDVFGPEKLSGFTSGEFDVVTLWHVLEHLPHPKDILKEISRLLDSKGLCIIALPNTDSYDAKFYGKDWAAWDVPRHLWHFNRSSFIKLIEDSDLSLKSVRRMPLDSFYISILSERYLGSRWSFLKGITIGKIGWIFSWFNRSRSSSLIYILKKEN
jgi:2-polyprenyl-3-methyl-5-hydroxy-6-metoxy-1,4-benzoquinol methylase